MTSFTELKRGLPDGRKIISAEKNELFFIDFGGTSPVPVHNLLRPGIFK
jgi:hypothetical protein